MRDRASFIAVRREQKVRRWAEKPLVGTQVMIIKDDASEELWSLWLMLVEDEEVDMNGWILEDTDD